MPTTQTRRNDVVVRARGAGVAGRHAAKLEDGGDAVVLQRGRVEPGVVRELAEGAPYRADHHDGAECGGMGRTANMTMEWEGLGLPATGRDSGGDGDRHRPVSD